MKRIKCVFEMALVLFAAVGSAPAAVPPPARVGSIDYIEGKALVDGKAASGAREQLPILDNGHSLSTLDGHAEMLLTPGVFLRLDANSRIQLVNASLTDTRLRLEQGAAMLEVDNLHRGNLIRVETGAGMTTILKNGLYRFAAAPASVEVFSGQVQAKAEDVQMKAGKHRQVAFAPVPTMSKFKSPPEDDLSRWSRLRSEYEAEASVASAQFVVDRGWPWAYSDWMWNPWFDTWTWFPASGLCMNPYGFGFYSPWMVYDYFPAPYYGVRHFGFLPRSGRLASAQRGLRPGITAAPRFQPRPGFGAMRSPAAGMGMGRAGMGRSMSRMGAGHMSRGRR
jgi:hypothetical protein